MSLLLLVLPVAEAAIVVELAEAQALLARPGVAVLDVRGAPSYLAGHIPGAVRTDWRIGVDGGYLSGHLGAVEDLAGKLAALGVNSGAPVLVVGAWGKGWGEEGRVAWDLAYLGHTDVHVLRGGMDAWTGPTEHLPTRPVRGAFAAHTHPELRMDARTLRVDVESYTLLDVRTPEEFAGATPYGEVRGGHITGAVNLPWTDLLTATPPLPHDKPLVVYCTGGVRAGLAWALLTDAGYGPVMNYDGSWWEWSELYADG